MSALPVIAIVGNPNCGKSALFNALTGSRQKVANYPGVTVDRKEGALKTPAGRSVRIIDLPGTYSLRAHAADEAITRDVIVGKYEEDKPSLIVCVADATNLSLNLRLVVELKSLGIPVVLALNMMDLAKKRGVELDVSSLSHELGVPVIPTVATSKIGIDGLLNAVDGAFAAPPVSTNNGKVMIDVLAQGVSARTLRNQYQEVDRILGIALKKKAEPSVWSRRIDSVVLHKFFGPLVLMLVLAFVFQAIFSWAELPTTLIEDGLAGLGAFVQGNMTEGPLRSLLVDGIIAGVGSVLVFLPQILLLFLFILLLEDSGYMARAAFIMDKLMGGVGLNGRAFIPLLSSFACAIPGIMATRTISDKRDRLTTILIAPLMTCSARLPVYSLLIAAFIPNSPLFGPIRLQGAVMFGLYIAGILSALIVARVLKWSVLKGPRPTFLMEMPTYKVPSLRSVSVGLLERGKAFVQRAGTIILALTVILWFLASYPAASGESGQPAILSSYAGRLGALIEPILRPLGFDWHVAIAMVPGFAAREVLVGALGTVYAIEGSEDGVAQALSTRITQDWSLPSALSLLVFYIFAPQCLSTLVVARRETNSMKWAVFMAVYLSVLAYVAALATFNIATWMMA